MPPIDAKNIAKLFDQHAGQLEFYARQWTTQADDCVQEAFIEIAKQNEAPKQPLAWLYRVVKNRALNRRRSHDRRSKYESQAAAKESYVPSTAAESLEQAEQLQVTLNKLSQEQRELIVARIWSGLSWQQIADLTGLTTSTASRKYESALVRFKKLLESQYV